MTRIAAAIFLLSTTAAPATILCKDAPGREPGVHWWWRDIDGRRCWFKREGLIPPKSELRWEGETSEEVVKTVKTEPPLAPLKQQGPSIRILKTRVVWEGISEVEANWIDGDAPVDLMRGDALSGPAGVGGSWVVPSDKENVGETTSFAARFAPVIEFQKSTFRTKTVNLPYWLIGSACRMTSTAPPGEHHSGGQSNRRRWWSERRYRSISFRAPPERSASGGPYGRGF